MLTFIVKTSPPDVKNLLSQRKIPSFSSAYIGGSIEVDAGTCDTGQQRQIHANKKGG
jgi:hypothetical protein